MCLAIFCFSAAASLIDPNEIGFGGRTRSDNYDELVDALYANNRVVTTIGGDKLWVPWFSRSDSANEADLQRGNACNAPTIDWTHNCMVTDEFSQVGILVAMGKNQQRMDQFYNTVLAIKSSNGGIPAWRVYRNGDTIEACKQGINGNCDTASDATARIIIALFTASKNPKFTNEAQKQKYSELAKSLSSAFVQYEVDQTCRPSSLGYGNICYWMVAGSNAKRGGLASTDYGYTGYYADGIIAMLQACANTGDKKYCEVAKHFTLNYLEAAKFNGNTFSAPPGRSFKWTNLGGVPKAECTNTCSPVRWDSADAPRALGMCQANYYAKLVNYQLPGLDKYCQLWGNKYMNDPSKAPLQYYPDGTNSAPYQSGYFAQGLQALYQMGGHNPSLFKATIDNALRHYTLSTKTWDSQSAFGVYMQAFAVRALGNGIGRDEASFKSGSVPYTPLPTTPTTPVTETPSTPTEPTTPTQPTPTTEPVTQPANTASLASLQTSCLANGAACAKKTDSSSGSCRTVVYGTSSGDISLFACEKDNNYAELYTRSAPTGITYTACIGSGCVSNQMGFAKFQLSATYTPLAPVSTQPIQPIQDVTQLPVLEPVEEPEENPSQQSRIASLKATCNAEGEPCKEVSDETKGVCRTIVYGTDKGELQLFTCEKDNTNAELYVRNAPSDLHFTACVGSGCVTKDNGFARYNIGDGAVNAPVTQEPQIVPIAQSNALDVSKLPITVTPSGTLVGDYMDGFSCRKVQYNTQYGWSEAKVCAKEDHYEMYLLSQPNDASVCVGSNCVGKQGGFLSFTY